MPNACSKSTSREIRSITITLLAFFLLLLLLKQKFSTKQITQIEILTDMISEPSRCRRGRRSGQIGVAKAREEVPKQPPNSTSPIRPVSSWNPRNPSGCTNPVKTPIDLCIHHRQLPLSRAPPTGEPSHCEPSARQSPNCQTHCVLSLWFGCSPVGDISGQLVAADWTGVSDTQPWQDTILVVDVFARHLPCLPTQLKLLLTNRTARFRLHVRRSNFHCRHRLDCSFRSRRRVVQTSTSVNLDLGQLIQEPLKPGSHEEIRYGLRQGSQAWPGTVVIVQLKSVRRSSSSRTIGGAPEYDHWVEGGSTTAEPTASMEEGGRRIHLLQEPAFTVRTGDRRVRWDPHEAATSIAPVRRRWCAHRRRRRRFHAIGFR